MTRAGGQWDWELGDHAWYCIDSKRVQSGGTLVLIRKYWRVEVVGIGSKRYTVKLLDFEGQPLRVVLGSSLSL